MNRLLFILLPLFFVSGACGLIYEVVWSQLFVLIMGATTFAISTVLVAFMGGLALGSYLGGRCSTLLRRPVVAYACLEIGIGIYAVLLPLLLKGATPLYAALYPHVQDDFMLLTLVRFAVSSLYLLIPTTLMGATLPLLVEQASRRGLHVGRSVAWFYGINTLGAVVGSASAGFWIIPAFGLTASTRLAAALNVAVGLTALLTRPALAPSETSAAPSRSSSFEPEVAGSRDWWMIARPRCGLVAMIVFGVSGLAAMIYQVAWTRVLIPYLGPHTYSFTCVLTAFILGIGLGSLVVARAVDRFRNPIYVLALFQLGIAASAWVAAVALDFFPLFVRRVAIGAAGSFAVLMVSMFAGAMAVMIVPTLLMGATFPVVVRLVSPEPGQAGRQTGRAYAFNTVGTILGAFLTGFVLIPSEAVSLRACLLLGVAINALCGLAVLVYSAVGGLRYLSPWPVAVGLVTVGVIPLTPAWDLTALANPSYLSRGEMTRNLDVVFHREGIDATVLVTTDPMGLVSIWINNKCDGSVGMIDSRTQVLAAHVPALLADHPKQALLIGWGTGMTAGALTCHESIQRIDAVEISRGVIDAAPLFSDYNHDAIHNPKIHVIRQDGRNHLLLTDRTYDLIVSEPSNPWIAGVAYLFTHEFYELCARRLSDHGVILTWMHAYLVRPEDVRRVVHSVVDVFPHATFWMDAGDLLMVGSKQPVTVELDDWLKRFRAKAVHADLARIRCDRPELVLGLYVAGPDALRRWSADTPMHFDDRPTLQYTGPRTVLALDNYYTRIASEALALAGPSVTAVVRPDPNNPEDAEIIARTERVRQARRLLVEYQQAADDGRTADAIERVWEAYSLAPGDELTRYCLRAAADAYGFSSRETAPVPGLAEEPGPQTVPAPLPPVVPPTR